MIIPIGLHPIIVLVSYVSALLLVLGSILAISDLVYLPLPILGVVGTIWLFTKGIKF